MANKKPSLKLDFCLSLSQEELDKVFRLKKHTSSRKNVDLVYKLLSESYQKTFKEPFFTIK